MSEELPTSRAGLFRRVLSRLFESGSAPETSRSRDHAGDSAGDYTSIDRCEDREYVTLVGEIRTVTMRPGPGAESLEADLDDGTGVVTLIWIGRRRIHGIEPGRTLLVSGRIAIRPERLIMYNPRYELRVEGE